jgi:Tol biopolymer transport system component
MSRKAERLRVLDELTPPELWPDIHGRLPRDPPSEPMQGHRVLAGAVALLIALAGVAAVILAFSGERIPPAPTTTVGNGLLAFSGGGEIYVVEPNGGEPRQVTDFRGGEYGLDVHWSPDGTKFAFRVWTDGDYELFVMNADGTGLSNVTGSVGVSEFSWSPDGTMLAFTSFQQGTDLDVFVVRPDGTGLRAVVESQFTEHRPQWSPDGTRIAFERWPVRDRDPGTADIYVVDLETGEIVPLVTSPGYDTAIAWSPAGDTLAFTSDRDGDRDLFLVGADGSGERQLTDLTNEEATTAHGWSPDGTRLSFVVGDGEQWDLWIVNADGSGLLKLTPRDRDDGPAVWSPDGSLLAFTASNVIGDIDNTGTFDVYMIRPDGTGEQRITSGRVALGWDLSWQPLTDRAQPPPDGLAPKANGSIYFRVGGADGGSRIEAVEPDGSGRHVVFEGEVMRFSRIAWSPDGTNIAYQNPIVGERGIYVADPGGSDAVRLTDGVNDSWASWSPDGTRILFSSTLYDPSIEMCTPGDPHEFRCPTDIYVMDADGSNVVRLTDDPADEFQPVWSPDGSRIAFARSLSDQLSHPAIFTMNPDGTDVRQVSEATEGSDWSPTWAPDGSRLIFVGIHNENLGIWMVNEDGSGEHMVLGGVGAWFVIDAEWSPDGGLIAFVGNPTTGDYSPDDALYVMRPDGSGVEQIADAPGVGIAGDIAWQPLLAPAEGSEPPKPPSAEVIETFEVGVDVRSVVYGEGSVWVAAANNDGSLGGRIVRIDPESHEVQADITVEVLPGWEVGGGAMVVEGGSLWVTGGLEAPGNFDDPGGGADAAVIRIDTATNEVVDTFRIGATDGADLTFLNGELWVLVSGDERVGHSMEVVHVDPETGDVLDRIRLDASWAHTLLAADGRLITLVGGDDAVNVDGRVIEIDPGADAVSGIEIPAPTFTTTPVVWRSQVWVSLDPGFARFDPLVEGFDPPIRLPASFSDCCGFIEADDRGIWFLSLDEETGTKRQLNVFDPANGEVNEVTTLDEGSPVAMAGSPDAIWVLNYEGTLTHIALT